MQQPVYSRDDSQNRHSHHVVECHGTDDRRGEHGCCRPIAGCAFDWRRGRGLADLFFLFWGFGFLRLSTSGLSAQATGAENPREVGGGVLAQFVDCRALWASASSCSSPLLKPLSISLMGGSPEVQAAASTYFSYRIWAAPAALANFTIMGWFIGQGRTTVALITQLALNLTNMAFSALLVLHFDFNIAGVGMAVLIAEYTAWPLG